MTNVFGPYSFSRAQCSVRGASGFFLAADSDVIISKPKSGQQYGFPFSERRDSRAALLEWLLVLRPIGRSFDASTHMIPSPAVLPGGYDPVRSLIVG